jgi:hypothetical protein
VPWRDQRLYMVSKGDELEIHAMDRLVERFLFRSVFLDAWLKLCRTQFDFFVYAGDFGFIKRFMFRFR